MMKIENSAAQIMIGAGVLLILAGLFWNFFGASLKLGRLPGDIAIEKQNFKVYFPVATSLLISILLSLAFWIFQKFFKGGA